MLGWQSLSPLSTVAHCHGPKLIHSIVCSANDVHKYKCKRPRYLSCKLDGEKYSKALLSTNKLLALSLCNVELLPLVSCLIHVVASLPAKIASAEQSISMLRRLKVWLVKHGRRKISRAYAYEHS